MDDTYSTNLSRDNSVIILSADKGNATVLIDRSVYMEKLKNVLLLMRAPTKTKAESHD